VPVAAVAATGLGIGAAVLVGVMFMLVPVVTLATAWHPLVRIKLQLHRLAAAKLLQLQRSPARRLRRFSTRRRILRPSARKARGLLYLNKVH
jgi:hypothetical protein